MDLDKIVSSQLRRGIFTHPIIELSGRDARDFLQRITSQNFTVQSETYKGAFLTATAGVIATFRAFQVGADEFLLLVSSKSVNKALKYIEKMHFGEELHYHLSERWSGVEEMFEASTHWNYGPLQVLEIRHTEMNPEYSKQKILRFEPMDVSELTEKNIILEAGLVDFVHRDKGCYPGQEVIERIYTYGNIPRKLVQLCSPEEIPLADLFIDGHKSGRATSGMRIEGVSLGFGYVLRDAAKVGQRLQFADEKGVRGEILITRVVQDLDRDIKRSD